MRRLIGSFAVSVLAIVVVLMLVPMAYAAQGHIQIVSEGGIQIFLDDTFKGVTDSSVGGLIIQNVPAGKHTIKAAKEGFQAQVINVQVKAGEVFSVKIKPFKKSISIEESGDVEDKDMSQNTGSLIIQTLPVEASVTIEALDVRRNSKSKDKWSVKDVPIGQYDIVVESKGKSLKYKAKIRESAETQLFFNFVTGKVEAKTGVAGSGDGPIVKIGNLMWQKEDDNVRRTWDNAMRYCMGLSLGGYSGWRLPSIDELKTLIDTSKKPTIDTNLFPTTKGANYWSSATNAYGTSNAWLVYFYDGYAFNGSNKTYYSYVRCVR